MDDPQAPQNPTPQGTGAAFPATRWSLIAGLAEGTEASRRRALEELCQAYWFPLYAFARHQGHPPHHAEDLTQGFFAHLLSHDRLDYLQETEGRLRSYLLAAMKRFMIDDWRASSAQKRGGTHDVISIHATDADGRYLEIASGDATPEDIFHQQWVLSLLTKARERVAAQYAGGDKANLFALIEPAITDPDAIDYAAAIRDTGMTSGALRTAVHRLRRRFGEAIRHEIAETVTDPEAAEAEYRELLGHG